MSVDAGAESQATAPEPLTPGEWLKRERERRGLSLEQAAEELRLDPWIVRALEANNFAALGAPVYARGHLKKYALELGLPPERVLELYEALHDTPVEPTPIPATLTATSGERHSLKAPLWALAILVVAALAWLALSLESDSEQTSSPATPVAVAPPALEEAPPTAPGVEPGAAVSPAPSEPSAQEQREAAAPVAQATPAQQRPASESTPEAAGQAAAPLEVRLEFSAPSWTEVYDASGRQLMFATGLPGSVRTISGVPPLRVTLGLASAVEMQVDGSEVLIPRRAGRDATTFVIEADGSVRPQTPRSAMTNSEIQ